MGEREERSRRFGFKLGKALHESATETAATHDLDARYVVEGAAQFLSKTAERELRSGPDDGDAGDRQN